MSRERVGNAKGLRKSFFTPISREDALIFQPFSIATGGLLDVATLAFLAP
jgi:hypothetical protein